MIEISKQKKIFEGKTKIIFETNEEDKLIQYYKDDVTAFNKKKSAIIEGKGALCNQISEHLMINLQNIGICTHYIDSINHREQLVRNLDMIQVEVVVRNHAAGSLLKRFNLEKNSRLSRSIVEFYLKDETLEDPLVTEEHITCFSIAIPPEIDEIMSLSLRINDFLQGTFSNIGIKLIDFKLEFGRHYDEAGEIRLILADELSPDNMRLVDVKTGNSLDKDVFRLNTGDLMESYSEIARRLKIRNLFNVITGK